MDNSEVPQVPILQKWAKDTAKTRGIVEQLEAEHAKKFLESPGWMAFAPQRIEWLSKEQMEKLYPPRIRIMNPDGTVEDVTIGDKT